MRSLRLLAFVALLGACASSPKPVTTTTAATVHEALPFIHDDYPRAMAEAKQKGKPLFVDAWAPWCHSCMSLKTYVLTDRSLAPLAKDFVWLAVDVEREVNAKWVADHPHDALPTLWVIDPANEKSPLLKWAGTVTASELRDLLSVTASKDASMASFIRGNHALAEGDTKLAIAEHRAALAEAKRAKSPQQGRIVEALVTELSLSKDEAACAELAGSEAADLAPGTSRATVLVTGLSCARDAKNGAARDRLLALASHDASARDQALLPDDRAAIYEEVVLTKKDAGDIEGARKTALDWSAFLDEAAAHAQSKDARTSLDPWRVASAIAMGDPAHAIPPLEASARDFPADYNPPARLGRVYLALKRLPEAEKAADRAIALVYGPRAMRVYELRADIAKAKNDVPGEVRALDEALAKSEHAVLTAGQKRVRDGIAKRAAALR